MFLNAGDLVTLIKVQIKLILTCYLSDHSLGDPSVCQE